MINNRDGTNEKPRLKVAPSNQGRTEIGKSNSSTNGGLNASHSRYEKGMELYKEGKVKVGPNGLFKVSGYYEADTERMTCTCPDYRTRKESCKHLFAAMLFVKNRGKQSIADLEGFNGKVPPVGLEAKDDMFHVEPSDKPTEAPSKPFDRQATITRLAVLNTAVAALQTHSKPIEYGDIVSLAAQLEQWALGREVQHEG